MAGQLPPLLATVTDVADALGEEITSEEDITSCEFALRHASAQVRQYGRDWNDVDVPEIVYTIVVQAAIRGYLNVSGFTQERGDTLNLKRDSSYARGSSLTDDEKDMIRDQAGKSPKWFTSVPLTRPEHVSDRYPGEWWGDSCDETFTPA